MKCTLMYRAEDSRGEVTITSDRRHAERSGTIKKIYRSKKYVVPALTACIVPKGTAPWEIASELEALESVNTETNVTRRVTFQLTDLGKLGDLLLNWFANGNSNLWDSQIVIVPESFVPKKELASTADGAEEEGEDD